MSELGFEGFDHENNYHLSEKEERSESWSQAKIWVVLGLFIGLLLGITIYISGNELNLKLNGKAVVTDYANGAASVIIQDDQGNKYYINVSDTILSPQNGKITVYYKGDNMGSAKALNAVWFWVLMYCVWIPLILFCVHRIIKNVRPSKKNHQQME
jgi:hypothetical protein